MTLDRYAFTGDQLRTRDIEFLLKAQDIDLAAKCPELNTDSGIYLWTFTTDRPHRLYVGKAKSLRRRISDYLRDFQIMCPNDFKIKIFNAFLTQELGETPSYDVYFKSCEPSELVSLEEKYIKKFNPILNLTKKEANDPELIKNVERAVTEYYFEILRRRIA